MLGKRGGKALFLISKPSSQTCANAQKCANLRTNPVELRKVWVICGVMRHLSVNPGQFSMSVHTCYLFDLQSAYVWESGQKIVYKQGNWNQRICKTFSVTQSRLLVATLWANWSHESKARESTRNCLLCCTSQLGYWGINLSSSSFHHINPFLFLSHTRIIPIPTFWDLISASWDSHLDNSRQFLTWELEYLNAETDQMSHYCDIVH